MPKVLLCLYPFPLPKKKKSIFFYFFRDRDKRHFGTFGTFGGEHILGDGGKILLCAAVSGLGAEVDSSPTEQVEEAAVGYPRALGTEAAGVLGVALSGGVSVVLAAQIVVHFAS